eukprot:14978-Pelagococcus_subviridis.AAC.12
MSRNASSSANPEEGTNAAAGAAAAAGGCGAANDSHSPSAAAGLGSAATTPLTPERSISASPPPLAAAAAAAAGFGFGGVAIGFPPKINDDGSPKLKPAKFIPPPPLSTTATGLGVGFAYPAGIVAATLAARHARSASFLAWYTPAALSGWSLFISMFPNLKSRCASFHKLSP